MYDYFEAFSIIPYRLATNGQFATTWTKKTPMHKRTVKKNTNYFYDVTISISLTILSEIFIQIDYLL